MSGTEWTIFSIKAAFSLATVVVVAVYIILPIIRVLNTKHEIPGYEKQDFLPEDLIGEDELQIPQASDGKPSRQAILEMARSDPRQTAMLLTAWLKERK